MGLKVFQLFSTIRKYPRIFLGRSERMEIDRKFNGGEKKWHSYDGFCGFNQKAEKELDTVPFRSHTQFFLFCFPFTLQVGRNSIEYSNMMMGLKANIFDDPFFRCASSRSILRKMCWILAFTIRSIFAQFPHYLNVHFRAIFYTLVFGFSPSLFLCWVPLYRKMWKNREIYRIVSCVTERNCYM